MVSKQCGDIAHKSITIEIMWFEQIVVSYPFAFILRVVYFWFESSNCTQSSTITIPQLHKVVEMHKDFFLSPKKALHLHVKHIQTLSYSQSMSQMTSFPVLE